MPLLGFAGLFSGIDDSLHLPEPELFSIAHVVFNPATSGVRFQRNGLILDLSPSGGNYGADTDWINADVRTAVIGDDFEVRYSSVTGDTSYMTGAAVDTWHTINGNIDFRVFNDDAFSTREVTGTVEVREIADTGNNFTTTMRLRSETEDGS